MLVFWSVWPSLAWAQSSVSFSVSPTIFDMTANPGQTWQSTLRIINPNSFPLTLYIERNHFIPKEEDGVPQFIPLGQSQDDDPKLADWMEVPTELTIEAEQMVELPIKISIPADTAPGGHYAALMISTRPNGAAGTSIVQTSQIISALVFLRVTGDISESSTIRSFRTADYFLSKPETTFEIRVENRGNVHVQPQGEIKIYNMWGQERGIIPVNQRTLLGNVLPNSVRKFSFAWTSKWSVSDIGRYTAVATLAYGVDSRQFMSADTAFWIIPWKIILMLIAVLGSLIYIITWAIKLYVRHVLALAGVTAADLSVSNTATLPRDKKGKIQLKARDVAAPIGISILDLRSRLKRTHGPWTDKLQIYYGFLKTYWKFFTGVGAILVLGWLIVWFVTDALSPSRDYEVTDPSTGTVVSSSAEANQVVLEDALGLPIKLVGRTKEIDVITKVADKAVSVGFTIATTTSEIGVGEEKTVIVYDPEVSEQALLLSRTLNNALLSAFTTIATSTEKIIVYVGKDAVVSE